MKTRKLDIGDKLTEPEPEEQARSWPEHWHITPHWDRYARSDGLQIDGDILLHKDCTFEQIDEQFPLGTGENKLLVMSCTDYQECDIVVLDPRLPVKEEIRKGSKGGCYIIRYQEKQIPRLWPDDAQSHWAYSMFHLNRYVRNDGLQVDGDVLIDHTLEEIDERFPIFTYDNENKLLMMSCTDYGECDIVVLDPRFPIKEEVRKGSKRGCYIVRSN